MIAPNYDMTNVQLEKLIRQVGELEEGRLGFWRVCYHHRLLYVVSDEGHNRMRIMTAIIEEEELDETELRRLLSANFDRALDPKYALADGYLWALYTHPLRELADEQFLDAMLQVKTLADNFGHSYASSELFFGGND